MPSVIHEDRAEMLDTLAVLAGFLERVGCPFPDRATPDVLRISLARRAMFIGEAKASESPGDTNAQIRLLAYLRWTAAATLAGVSTVFAMCIDRANRCRWRHVVLDLTAETSLATPDVDELCFGTDAVILFSWPTCPAGRQPQ